MTLVWTLLALGAGFLLGISATFYWVRRNFKEMNW